MVNAKDMGHPIQGPGWGGLFILIDTSYASVTKHDLITNGNMYMLFHQIGYGNFEWQILNMVQHVVLDEVLRLGKTIDLHMYNCIDSSLSEDPSYELFHSLVIRRAFTVGSFLSGIFQESENFGFYYLLQSETHGSFLNYV